MRGIVHTRLIVFFFALFFKPLFAAEPLPLPQFVQVMQARESELEEQIERAKRLKKLTVLNCLDEKHKTVRGLVVISQRTVKSAVKAEKEGNRIALSKYRDRIVFAHKRVQELHVNAQLCWREEVTLGETKVTLKVPELAENQLDVDDTEELADLESIAGYPEVPAASPFR